MASNEYTAAVLEDKANEFRQLIVTYQEKLEQTRKELACIVAAKAILQRGEASRIFDGPPIHVRNLFALGEAWRICKAALADKPEGMTTRDLAVACLVAKDFDSKDAVLIRGMVGILATNLRKRVRRRELVKIPVGYRAVVWRLPTEEDLAGLPGGDMVAPWIASLPGPSSAS